MTCMHLKAIASVAVFGIVAGLFLPAFSARADMFENASVCNIEGLMADLAAKDDLDAVDEDGNTPLHWAARNGYDACVEILIDAGAAVNLRNHEGETPFMMAAVSSADQQTVLRSLQLLLDAGADPLIANRFGYSPLFALIVYGNGMAVLFDPAMIEPNLETGIPPYKGGAYEVAKLLLDAGNDPNEVDGDGRSVIQFAVQSRMPAVVELLVSRGGNIAVRSPDLDRSMLHIAALNGRAVSIPYLIEKGLPLDDRDANGATPLILAAVNDYPEIVEMLIAAGADMDAKDNGGFTAVILAADYQNLDTLRFLLENGADPNRQTDERRNTALQYAVSHDWEDGVELLMQYGADPVIANAMGATAFDYIVDGNNTEMRELLNN